MHMRWFMILWTFQHVENHNSYTRQFSTFRETFRNSNNIMHKSNDIISWRNIIMFISARNSTEIQNRICVLFWTPFNSTEIQNSSFDRNLKLKTTWKLTEIQTWKQPERSLKIWISVKTEHMYHTRTYVHIRRGAARLILKKWWPISLEYWSF